jgi:hypothetical protein
LAAIGNDPPFETAGTNDRHLRRAFKTLVPICIGMRRLWVVAKCARFNPVRATAHHSGERR